MSLSEKQKERLEKAKIANRLKRERRMLLYQEKPKKCLVCEKVMSYKSRNNKYCSHGCSAKVSNQGCVRNFTNGQYAKKKCGNCGEETCNKKYCSENCAREANATHWHEILETTGVCKGAPATIRKYLVKLDGHLCSICLEDEWCGQPIPLVLDHINGKPSDNRRTNLRLVCGNCNMQLSTFAGRNVGKGGGRPYRNKRYSMGLSY